MCTSQLNNFKALENKKECVLYVKVSAVNFSHKILRLTEIVLYGTI